jgi:hypothetical protein
MPLFLAFGAPRIRAGWTYGSHVTALTTRHMVGDESAPFADWQWFAVGRVSRSLELELGVDLGTEQHDVESKV